MTPEVNLILLIIYTISWTSAFFCLWVKWEQDEILEKQKQTQEEYEKIQQQLEKLQKELERKNIKGPFKHDNN